MVSKTLVAAGTAAALAGGMTQAHAQTSGFQFTGTCTSGCSGSGTAYLSLENYSYGQAITSANTDEAFYNSSSAPSSPKLTGSSGSISGPGPAYQSVHFVGKSMSSDAGASFQSNLDGSWSLSDPGYTGPSGQAMAVNDSGTGGTWEFTDGTSPTGGGGGPPMGGGGGGGPEPSTWLLMMVGVGMAGLSLRAASAKRRDEAAALLH